MKLSLKPTSFWDDHQRPDGPLPDAPSLNDGPWFVVLRNTPEPGQPQLESVEYFANHDLAQARAKAFNTEYSGGDWVATIKPANEMAPTVSGTPQAA